MQPTWHGLELQVFLWLMMTSIDTPGSRFLLMTSCLARRIISHRNIHHRAESAFSIVVSFKYITRENRPFVHVITKLR